MPHPFLLLIFLLVQTLAQNGLERVLPKSNVCEVLFQTGFESWDDFKKYGYRITPTPASGSLSADNSLTKTSIAIQDKLFHSGSKAMQATAYGIGNSSHVAYPTINFSKLTSIAQFSPVYAEIWIYVDKPVPSGQWSSLATFFNGVSNDRTIEVNLDDSMLVQLNNVPFQYQQEPNYQNPDAKLQVGKWTNLTVYIDFNPMSGVVAVWIDGNLSTISDVKNGNGGLYNAHFGMYESKWISSGSVYNDDLKILSVNARCKGLYGGDSSLTADTSSIQFCTFLIIFILTTLL